MNKRGSAAVLAMIFLVVFSALSCAFYVMINTSLQVGKNDRNSVRARSAAESGMEMVKHHLSRVKLASETTDAEVIPKITTRLDQLFGASADRLNPNDVFATPDGSRLTYPELKLTAPDPSCLQPRTFDAVLLGEKIGSKYVIQAAVDGVDRQSKLSRSMTATFYARPVGREIFEYDIASAGPIWISNADIAARNRGRANVMSASEAVPSISIESSELTGGLAVVVTEKQVHVGTRGQVLVNNENILADIMKAVTVIDPPSIPGFETQPFYDAIGGAAAQRIAPGDIGNNTVITDHVITWKSGPTNISGDVTMNGIIYVESPNQLTFHGKLTLNGIIVFQKAPTLRNDYIKFGSNVTQDPLVAQPHPEAIGYSILAPTAGVILDGSASLSAQGSIVCYTFSAMNSGFDLNVNDGTLLTLSTGAPSLALGQGTISFTRSDSIPPTTGVIYQRQYVIDPSTYVEVVR